MANRNSKNEVITRDLSKSFSTEETELFEDFLKYLKYKNDFLEYLKEKQSPKKAIPISIFATKDLAPLEAIVKYLREECGYAYDEIGSILNRKAGPIGVTYRNAKKKNSGKLDISSTSNSLPVDIFKNSEGTVFETIVVYLKDPCNLKFKKIAELLNRNYRTIYTVYNRANNKRIKIENT